MSSRVVIAILFLFSGVSALGYQVVWQRVLTQEIGVDTVSIAFIVTIFLLGIGAGSYAHRFLFPLAFARKRIVYVGIEAAIGVFGAFSIDILRFANQFSALGSSVASQFALNMAILFLPTFLMGLTTPLILDLVRAKDDRAGRTVGLFYGMNVLGASMGAIVTGLVLIELFGLRGVGFICAGINIMLGACFWWALKDEQGATTARGVSASSTSWRFIWAALAFGYAAMALQMGYFRTAFNHFQIYSFIFPFMLGVFLLAMALGQFVFGQIADRTPTPRRALSLMIGVAGFATSLAAIYLLPISWLQPSTLDDYWGKFALYALVYSIPIGIGSGLFTLLVRYSTKDGAEVGAQFGRLMAAVSLGNVLGAFSAPVFLFEMIGTMGTLLVAGVLYLAGAFGVTQALQRSLLCHVAAFIAVIALAVLPHDYFTHNKMFKIGAASVRTVEDGVGIVSAFEYNEGKSLSIQIFRSPTSTIFRGPQQGYDMTPLHRLLPDRPARMLVIGLGGANYLPSLVNSPKVGEITIVELSPAVLHEVRLNGTPAIKAALESPKVKLIVDDGRRYVLAAARKGERFDVIQNGVFQPWMSGAGNLYSVEMAKHVRGILRPGGIYFTLDLELISISVSPAFRYAYSAPPHDRYIYFVANDAPLEIPGLCRRDLSDITRPLNTDDRPISEYWMLSLLRHTLSDALRAQIEYYRHPCEAAP